MIIYELAKKLKDAGFPQKCSSYEWFDTDGCIHVNPFVVTHKWTTIPTLSELIEACGDRFCELKKFDDSNFTATSYAIRIGDTTRMEYGSTPEEAVANLYLVLHQ